MRTGADGGALDWTLWLGSGDGWEGEDGVDGWGWRCEGFEGGGQSTTVIGQAEKARGQRYGSATIACIA